LYKSLIPALLIIGLSGCTANASQGDGFALSNILQRPEGSSVVVMGYLIYESHARQLWSSHHAYKQEDERKCLTLIGTLPHHDALSSNNRRLVKITGKLRNDVTSGYIDLGACNKTGIEIISVERP
jgi:hypothetical protein